MQAQLKAFADSLKEALGERLASVILYGSAAKGSHTEGFSDVNVLVVLRAVSLDDVARASGLARRAGERRYSLVFWSEAELRRCSDVFPIEYRDILSGYKVLQGGDALAGLAVDERNLRHQLEFELRSKLLRLRAGWPEVQGDKTALAKALAPAGASFARLLEEARGLPGFSLPKDAGRAFEECRKLKGAESRPGLADLEKLYADVHHAAEMVARAVDALD